MNQSQTGHLGDPVRRGRDEYVEVICSAAGTTVERIVSRGHTTDWLEQDHDEWVMVHSGAARLEMHDGAVVDLAAGDHLVLSAGRRHRVVWTDPGQPTVWVAVHFAPEEGPGGVRRFGAGADPDA